MKKPIFSIGVKEDNGTPQVMFLIDLLSDYAIVEQGYHAVIRVIDNMLKIQNERLMPDGYVDRMLDFRKRIESDAGMYSRYQEILQTEIADEIETPKKIPMHIRLNNILGDKLINTSVPTP